MAKKTSPTDFKDFSDRAKRAIDVAKELAQKLGDGVTATGHLIFGLTQDKAGITHHLFLDVNIDPEMFSGYVARLPREPAGEEGEPFHPHLHTVFERAREVKKALGEGLVTSEHLLVALMSIKEGTCYDTLQEFSVDPDDIRIECLEALGCEDEECPRWG